MKRFPFWVVLLLLPGLTLAEATWLVDFGIGDATNAPQSFTIVQENHPNLEVSDGVFTSRGLERPPLYLARIGRFSEHGRGWEVEFIHHKLFLNNPTQYDARLNKFEVTHGFNMFLVNRSWLSQRWEGVAYRLGAGTNYVHPDVRFDDNLDGIPDRNNYNSGDNVLLEDWRVGYHWGGYALHASIAKVWSFNNWRMVVEPKLYHSKLQFPVNDGHVLLSNSSASLYVSVGYQF